jgi:hypothetical protein
MTNAKKAFKKFDEVTLISNWDRNGKFAVRNAIVWACGKVRMTLIDAETGETLGEHFLPAIANRGEAGTHPRLSAEEGIAYGTEAAVNWVTRQTAYYRTLLEAGDGTMKSGPWARAGQWWLDTINPPSAERHYDLTTAAKRRACNDTLTIRS